MTTHQVEVCYKSTLYSGPSGTENPEANRLAFNVIEEAEATFKKLGLTFSQKHIWPEDIHYEIQSEVAAQDLEKLLNKSLRGCQASVERKISIVRKR
jgi:hypothetical protein